MMDTKSNTKNKRQPEKKPKKWLYSVVRIALVPWSKLTFKLNCKIDPAIANCTGGLVLVGHHVSYLDPLWTIVAMKKHHIRFVVGNYLLRTKSAPLFRAVGVIGKEQFVKDLGAVRELIAVARQGNTVMFFPEGQRTTDGKLCPIDISAAKLLQKIGVQVGVVKYIGGYLAWPRWAKFWRPGPVTVEIVPFLTPETMKQMSPEDVLAKLLDAMQFDDYAMQLAKRTNAEQPEKYGKRKLAEGLSGLLHLCPFCQTPHILEEHGGMLRCRRCGGEIELDSSGLYQVPIIVNDNITLKTPRDHHDWQRSHASSLISPLQFEATMRYASPNKLVHMGEATITVANKTITAELKQPFEINGVKHTTLSSTVLRPDMMFIEHGQYLQIYVGELIFRMYPKNPTYVIAVADLLRNMVDSEGYNKGETSNHE